MTRATLTVIVALAMPAMAAAQTRTAQVEAPAGAISCTTSDAGLSYATGETVPAARSAAGSPNGAAICASAQDAMSRINASEASRTALIAAVDAGDNAALRSLLLANGLSPDLGGGAQFHAINTKGTGATNGRTAAPAGMTVGVGYDARTKRGYSLANWMHFNAK